MIKDRIEAGQLLAERIVEVNGVNTIVLAIPRGGIITGYEIAKKLRCGLDVAISKKITPPDNPEYAIGAITCDGILYCGDHWDSYSNHPDFEDEINKKKNEVKRRLQEYRGSDIYKLNDKTVILVDDGIATGSTVFAILNWLSKQKIKNVILAIPVMPASIYEVLETYVSAIVVLEVPTEFSSVGQFYKNFDQVSDLEVMKILEKYKN